MAPDTFTSGGIQLSYRSVGSGPAVVLIHGWSANGDQWKDVGWLNTLLGRRLLIPDLRGHGASGKPHDSKAYRMDALASDVFALLDAAGEAEADVFGYSMGGTIALWTTVLGPSRVRALIAGGVADASGEETAALGRELAGEAPPSARSERYRAYIEKIGKNDMEAVLACLAAGVPAPQCQELAVFGGEALLAAGDLDFRRARTESLAGCLPGGRFLLLDGADHMGGFEDQRFKSAVVEFLDEVSPR
jgi:pimeloyl-ACP methyl ester carboxylesterase